MKAPATAARTATTTRLGDWYAHALGDSSVVLCVSLKTLLPVLIEPERVPSLPEGLARGAAELLHALGVAAADIEAEAAQMQQPAIGKTTKRWVNDAMRDFDWLLEARLAGGAKASLELALWLAETPCVLLSWKSPDEVTRELFGLSSARHRLGPPTPRGAAPAPLPAQQPTAIWSPALALGIEEIDQQHQGLFAAFAGLGEVTTENRAEAARMLDFLGRYVVEHFATEEQRMVAAAYPGYEAHKAEHDALVDELKDLRERWRSEGPSAALGAALSGRIRSWLSFHIGGSDRAMGRFLTGQTMKL